MFCIKKRFILILFSIFMLVSCSKTGTKNVDKVNNEIKNSTSQFSLNTEELAVLEKPYRDFSDEDKKVFNKILEKYNKFKENSSNDIAFETKILEKLEEIENFYGKKYINFKNESSINVKVEEKLLNQNTKTELSKKEFSYDNYLIKLTGKGNFKYSVDKRIICEETLKENEKPRYVRIKILENSNVEFNGNIIGIIFKDNIKYDDFKNLPSGIFSIETDLKQGTYKISNTTKDTIIKTISKNNEVKILNLQESHEIKLENEMKLIISGVDYITLEKID
ncbi:hypothetical protein VJJ74_00255 [Parvimonas micra]|uniref:Lipoprotein n=2 Tax=Parvimonas micra TaxID=33033 RepID=A0A0B4S1I0_9FIRM|nr:hypothetical protein [Parvimonas micra]AIZ36608.1 hypothetical protein NW74_04305 [Parvimonas micra]MBF1306628.1 hypothetical protein [Parvimonas micra]MCK6129995.1 hypothetical protein [Parvimonas micra]MCK6135641.1 hypothetical protein [Parvimonas micra]MCK6137113.1 hypothetical protein [Parvimonas micra]